MPISSLPFTPVAIARFVWSPRADWLLVSGLAPLLLFPTMAPRITIAATLAYVLASVVARAWGRPLWVRSPLDPALLVIAATVTVAAIFSPLPEVSAPKFAGVLLGVLVYRTAMLAIGHPSDATKGGAVYLLSLVALLAPALLATAWLAKVPLLPEMGSRMPRLIQQLPGTSAEGVHPNAIGATTLFALPGLVVVLSAAMHRFSGRRRTRSSGAPEPATTRAWLSGGVLTILGALTVALGGLLLVSQSRTAWLAMALTLAVLSCLTSRTARIVSIVAIAAVLAAAVTGWDQIAARLASDVGAGSPSVTSTVSLAGRLEVWSRALFAIEDFPLTGMGLNTFRRVVHVLYPLYLTSPDFDIAHAHNVFLQTALDVGLPGLVAYVALLLLATVMAYQVWTSPRTTDDEHALVAPQALALACWANLFAIHCWGLGDAIVLGAKVGVFVWFSLGLIAALHRVTVAAPPAVAEGPAR